MLSFSTDLKCCICHILNTYMHIYLDLFLFFYIKLLQHFYNYNGFIVPLNSLWCKHSLLSNTAYYPLQFFLGSICSLFLPNKLQNYYIKLKKKIPGNHDFNHYLNIYCNLYFKCFTYLLRFTALSLICSSRLQISSGQQSCLMVCLGPLRNA